MSKNSPGVPLRIHLSRSLVFDVGVSCSRYRLRNDVSTHRASSHGNIYANIFEGDGLYRIEIKPNGSAGTITKLDTSRKLYHSDGLRRFGSSSLIMVEGEKVGTLELITISGTVHGHPAGASQDLEDTLNFAALQGIKPMVEVLPLEKAADGYQRMIDNQARFRVVLTTEEMYA